MIRPSREMFTVKRKEKYLALLRDHPEIGGSKSLCAEAIGITTGCINEHLRVDPVFKEMYEEAREAWVDENLLKEAIRRAIDGDEKKIFGGKDKNELLYIEKRRSDRLLELLLKANRKEFRNNYEGTPEENGSVGGVMIVPSAPTNIDDWEAAHGEAAKGKTGHTAGGD